MHNFCEVCETNPYQYWAGTGCFRFKVCSNECAIEGLTNLDNAYAIEYCDICGDLAYQHIKAGGFNWYLCGVDCQQELINRLVYWIERLISK